MTKGNLYQSLFTLKVICDVFKYSEESINQSISKMNQVQIPIKIVQNLKHSQNIEQLERLSVGQNYSWHVICQQAVFIEQEFEVTSLSYIILIGQYQRLWHFSHLIDNIQVLISGFCQNRSIYKDKTDFMKNYQVLDTHKFIKLKKINNQIFLKHLQPYQNDMELYFLIRSILS